MRIYFQTFIILSLYGNLGFFSIVAATRNILSLDSTTNRFHYKSCNEYNVEKDLLNKIGKCYEFEESKDFITTSDGFVKINRIFYPQQGICIDTKYQEITRICYAGAAIHTVWKKCCPEDAVWDAIVNQCQRSKNPFRLKLGTYLQPFQEQEIHQKETHQAFPIKCTDGFEVISILPESCAGSHDNSKFLLTKEGIKYESTSGLFHRRTELKLLNHNNYCADGYLSTRNAECYDAKGSPNAQNMDCSIRESILFLCNPSSPLYVNNSEENGQEKSYYLAAIWISSCPLLLISAGVNIVFVQRNVHGWTLSSYLISIFLVNINSAVLALQNQSDSCRLIDFSIKYFYLSTLCWITSINVRLWTTFRESVRSQEDPKRFLSNCIFSLGLPFLVVTASYFFGRRNTCDGQFCALYSHAVLPIYSGPVVLLILINLVLFVRTSLVIAARRRETSSVLHPESNDNLESFRLFAKLFLMTGSIWILRVILLFLQIQGLYLTWSGIILEAVFSIPEIVFSIIILLHPQFVNWMWKTSPRLSKSISKILPCFEFEPTRSLEDVVRSNPTTTAHSDRSPSAYQ